MRYRGRLGDWGLETGDWMLETADAGAHLTSSKVTLRVPLKI